MLEAGSTVGDYTVQGVLGEGGFGVVYRALDGEGRSVALKVASTAVEALSTKELVWQHNEIEALVRLKHASLVELYGHGFLDDGRLYFAMELVDGQPLDEYLRTHGRLDAVEAIAIVQRIVECLRYCHGENVLHLDLKLPNVLLVDPVNPSVKVLDFGLATLLTGYHASDGTIAGTPGYMPPEAFTATVPPSPTWDLYALGVMLFELLTGKTPYEADSLLEIFERKRTGERPAPSSLATGVPTAFDRLIDELLDPVPRQRPRSAAEVEARVQALYYAALRGHATQTAGHRVLRTSAKQEGMFVGRAAELGAITERWNQARCGTGAAICVTGPAGVGKSRLIGHFLATIEAAETAWVGYGRCRQVGGLVPFVPLREALSEVLGRARKSDDPLAIGHDLVSSLGDEASRLAALIPELDAFLPDGLDEPSSSISNPAGGGRIGRLLAAALAALANAKPVVLVLEDLHWADLGVGEALDELVASGLPRGVLVIATRRPSEVSAGRASIPTLHLAELSPTDADSLLSALLGGARSELVAELKRRVPLLAAGNPLFVTSVIRDLVESGCLVQGPDGETAIDETAMRGYRAPDNVSDVIERILDRVDGDVLAVLRVAALIGRKFRPADIASLDLFPPASVTSAVAEAHSLHLCSVDSGGAVLFAHDSVREQLDAHLDASERPALHRKIAAALEARQAPAGDLAHHLLHGGKLWDAAQAFVAAGLEADTMLDALGAASQMQNAVELLVGMQPTAERDRLLANATFELVRLACQIGDTEATLSLVREAARSVGPDSLTVTIALQSAFARLHYVRGEFEEALRESRSCLAATEFAFAGGTLSPAARDLRKYRLAPSNILGRALCASGKFGEAVPHLQHGCDLAKHEGDLVELSHSTGMLGLSLGYSGKLEQARKTVAVGSALAKELGDPVRKLGALFYDAVAAECGFDYTEGVRVSIDALRLAEESSLGGLYVYLTLIFGGRHQFHVGRLRRAGVLLGQAIDQSQRLGISMGLGWAYAFLGDVKMVLGDADEAGGLYEKGLATARQGGGDALAECYCLAGIVHHAGLRGDQARVLSAGEDAIRCCEASANLRVLIDVLQRYAEALEAVGLQSSVPRARLRVVFAELGVDPIDWWPRVPDELRQSETIARTSTSQPSSSREFWSGVASADLVPLEPDPTLGFAETAWASEPPPEDADTERDLPAVTVALMPDES